MDTILKTNGLSKTYHRFKALDDISFQIPKGAIYGLVGQNGAGKTTLIRLLTGLQSPTSGHYELYGIRSDTDDVSKARRRMGAVVETPSLYLMLSAEDNLKYQYKLLGIPSYSGIHDALQLVGLADTGSKKVKDFSLGMKQRLGIAIALAGDPDFLVLDEPINGLDPQGIIEIRELLLKLNREHQITILISSHILSELSKLATHFGFIHNGHFIKSVSASELEAACQKCTRIKVSDCNASIRALDKLGLQYTVLAHNEIDIYSILNITELTLALQNEGSQLLNIQGRDESLESFYMKMIGGALYE